MQNLCYLKVLVWLKHIELRLSNDEVTEIRKVAGMHGKICK